MVTEEWSSLKKCCACDVACGIPLFISRGMGIIRSEQSRGRQSSKRRAGGETAWHRTNERKAKGRGMAGHCRRELFNQQRPDEVGQRLGTLPEREKTAQSQIAPGDS